MLKQLLIFLISIFLFAFTPVKLNVKQKKEIVFCLDMSASTNGLIGEIRDNLWRYVNYAQRINPETDLRIGIVGYGRPSFGSANDYVKIICDLTSNYDLLSSSLFDLKINVEKGDQMIGSALYASCKNLNWSMDAKKTILLFGNGNVKLGRYNYQKACEIASENKIAIYPVYCIEKNIIVNDVPGYKSIAEMTGGSFNTMMLSHVSPLKSESADAVWLKNLNDSLNKSYIYYSANGIERYKMMVDADKNSLEMNERFFYSRCNYKTSDHYAHVCAEWDLISLMKLGRPDFTKINMAYLPKDYQQLSPQQLFETAMHAKEKRNKILADIKHSFINAKDSDVFFTNPIDSLIFQPIK